MSRSPRTRGYALVECLILISVIGALMLLCAGTIHLLLKLDRSGRDAAVEAADLARLARDFRIDAHGAGPADFKSANRIVLSPGGPRSVEYAIREVDILRTARDGEKIRGFETYRRPARASARIELEVDGPRAFAAIVLDRPSTAEDLSPYRDYRIEAEVGKHLRMTPRPE